jgi:hypothetical protein
MPDGGIASGLGVGTVLFVVLAFLTVLLAQKLENRLILLGLLAAVLGLLYGWLGGYHVGVARGDVSMSVGIGGVAGTMMKIGLVLVLGGVVVGILGRWPAAVTPVVPANREEAPRV